jgi:hypothetical protein
MSGWLWAKSEPNQPGESEEAENPLVELAKELAKNKLALEEEALQHRLVKEQLDSARKAHLVDVEERERRASEQFKIQLDQVLDLQKQNNDLAWRIREFEDTELFDAIAHRDALQTENERESRLLGANHFMLSLSYPRLARSFKKM